jgi:hypothetical protein
MARAILRSILIATVLCASATVAQDKTAKIDFLVVRSTNGKPIRNAMVVLHSVSKDGKQGKGGMELKTDPEGHASIDAISYGTLRIQALAPHYQTYGDDVEINQPEQQITIKMNPPRDQYSIYQDHPTQDAPKDKPQDKDKQDPK